MPTPLAVALSDFCRRAKAPAAAAEVREALSLISSDDEFRVRMVTDSEPEATPLGPFAVIDVLTGTSAHLAAQRQAVGYYDVARSLAKTRAAPPPQPIADGTAPAPAALPELKTEARLRELLGPAQAAQQQKAKGKGKQDAPTMSEKIAPRRRTAAEAQPPVEADEARGAEHEDLEPAPEPDRPMPRGRFTRLSATREPISVLMAREGHDPLAALVDQYQHRIAVHRAVAAQYTGRRGPVTLEDVTAALARHGLLEELTRKEREALLGAYAEHRGASGRVAWALGVSPGELKTLISAAGLTEQVEALRERYRREAVSKGNLKQRLELVARTKYLDDLGVRRAFMDELRKDLRALLTERVRGAASLEALVQDVAKRQGIDPVTLRRAMDRLQLDEDFEKQVAALATDHA